MEINEDQSKKMAKGYLFRVTMAKVTLCCKPPSLCYDTQRQTEEWESFMVEKGEDPCGPGLEAVVVKKLL